MGRACSLLAVVLLAGCTAVQPTASTAPHDSEPIQAVATISILADFVAAVGGDEVEVHSLVPVGGDPHVYEPVPADAIAIARADVVFRNGLGLSPWFDALQRNATGPVVTLTDGLTDSIVEVRVATGGRVPDPHLWMVPPWVADGYVTAVEEALAALAPAKAAAFARNAAAYRAALSTLDAELASQLAVIPPARRRLVTSHDAYTYFAEHYGLEVVGTVVGVTTEEQPSAATVADLIDVVVALDVPTIFLETTVNPAVMERIAADSGARLGAPLYGDSVGPPGSGAEDYEGMMRANARALVEGLT